MTDLAALEQQATTELADCSDEAALRGWHTKYFGKQGEIVLALRKVGEGPPAERKTFGQEANRIKEALTAKYDSALAAERERALESDLAADPLDVTLPGRIVQRGRLHLSTQVLRRVYSIFADMGFQVY